VSSLPTLAVTGGTGFIGQHVLRHAIAAGFPIRALTRKPQHPRPGVEWVQGSLEDEPSLDRLVAGSDVVLHIAGALNAHSRELFETANVAGTLAVVEAARAEGIKRFIHISSLSAREPQLSAYGASKARSEGIVSSAPLDWTIIRPPAVYGIGDTEMLELFRMARRGLVALPPKGRLSLIAVDDLVRLLLVLATLRDEEPATYEPDDGHAGGFSHNELAQALGQAVGRKRVASFALPRRALMTISRIERLLRGEGAKLTADRVGYFCHPDWVCRPDLQPPAAIWRPELGLEQGLRDTADWYRAAKWL
jgi:uncharacterized protein YbjT (DUF2867 family)